jgi:thymidylate kinase
MMDYRYIVVEGSIGSGKSAVSRRLAEYFRGSPYFVEVPPVQSPREADTALVSQRAQSCHHDVVAVDLEVLAQLAAEV